MITLSYNIDVMIHIFGLVERPGSTKRRVRHPPFLFRRIMKELSIFVDESGDLGEYDFHAPYYIISLVLHDQGYDVSSELLALEESLANLGWKNHCVHAGPVIRSEEEYKGHDLADRQKILKRMMSFVRHLDIKYKTIYIEKKHIEDSIEATGKLSKQLATFIRNNMAFFCDYDRVKVYYDNGQVEVTRILSSVFNALLENVEFRKVLPAHVLSNSEKMFFGDERTLKKNYIKPLKQREKE